MKKFLLTVALALFSVALYAQTTGVKGVVVSREGREAVGGVKVVVDGTQYKTTTTDNGEFLFENLPSGEYTLSFEAPEFETSQIHVRIYGTMKDLHEVAIVPQLMGSVDDSIFAEFDTDAESSGDTGSLPSSLSASKDVFNNIASYRFSEMRFNVRGYDSPYQDIYLNGIRFNDAITGYGPWSLWSGLNDATRNQESTSGLQASDVGVGNIGGTTNINARASQMRKGFRASVVNATQLYRFRVMLSYASGALDNGWSYGFSFSTRQGNHGYVNGVYYNAYGYFASAEKIFTILDMVPEVVDEPDAIELDEIKGEIEFKDVWFAYKPGEWVLQGVSFHVQPKQTVAFVGSTGSGKTTILSLICRNYDIQKGQILIDGIDIRKIKISSLRRHFGQMLQDVFLFSGDIRSNIVLREDNITDEQVWEACRYVNADKFIGKLENGLDEVVRERGNNFSAGQRQLLSFARTIIHKPAVMILDEATANIDTETEILIQDSLEKMKNIGTMLIVAHRLSTIQHSDNIILLSHGEIIEQGNHQQLLAQRGRYYDLYTLQYSKQQIQNR